MINKQTKYGLSDIVLEPAEISYIDSRSECNCLDDNKMLPLITSPMYSVVDEKNIHLFLQEGIYGIYPRGCKTETTLDNTFLSYGLDEFIELYLKSTPVFARKYILIDMANGHMIKLMNAIKEAKNKYGESLVIMAGNIANPGTYKYLAASGADYVRCGIGTGSACFVEGTIVSLKKDQKEIQDIEIGDMVLTHDGTEKEVIAISSHLEKENLIKINETVSTKEHKYYVLNKKYEKIVDESNIHNFAQWIEACNLTEDYFLIDLE